MDFRHANEAGIGEGDIVALILLASCCFVIAAFGTMQAGAAWLPLDTKSANFDNIADVQIPSATVLEAYLDAANAVSRLAVGDAKPSVPTQSRPSEASAKDIGVSA